MADPLSVFEIDPKAIKPYSRVGDQAYGRLGVIIPPVEDDFRFNVMTLSNLEQKPYLNLGLKLIALTLDSYTFNVRDYLSECLDLFDNKGFIR
jgi:hypothetical protein